MDEPMLRLWQGEGLRADPRGITLGGHWLSAPGWPASHARADFYLDDNRLVQQPPAPAAPIVIATPLHCGMTGGEWCPLDGGGSAPEFQADQRSDDGLSWCFDTPWLTAPLSLCGNASLDVAVAFDSPLGIAGAAAE